MVNVRSKILKIRNLPTDGKKIDQICAKPYLFIFILLVIGFCLLMTRLYLVGILILMLFLYYLAFVKNVTLIEFYDKYAIFYLNNGKDESFLLFWDDVEKYELISSRNDLDTLNIILKNNECIVLKCLGKKKVDKYFALYTKEENDCISKQRI